MKELLSSHYCTLFKRSDSRVFLKTISALLVSTMLFQDLLYANPDLKSIVQAIPSSELKIKIPESIGQVEKEYCHPRVGGNDKVSGNNKVIYLIQDAHTNESAQRNIAKILDTLIEKKPVKYVFLEAGTGDDSLSDLRALAPTETRKKISDIYLRRAYIQGPDYLDLTSEKNFKLWGVEDKELYYQGIELYRGLKKDRDHANAYLGKVRRTIQTLKPKIFNPQLNAFDTSRQRYEKEEISLTDYISSLTDTASLSGIHDFYPMISSLLALKEKESLIDFKKANEEQTRAAQALSEEDRTLLAGAAKKDKIAGKLANAELSGQGYYLFLEEKLRHSERSEESILNKDPSASAVPQDDGNYAELLKYFDI